MKRKLRSLLCLLLVATLLGSFAATALAAGNAYAGKTVILYTGNLRGDVDAYAAVKASADAYEAAGAEVLLVDAGNYLQGSAEANADLGAGIYTLMDATGYDVAALGLAELGYTDATTGYLYHGNFTRYYTQAELLNGAEKLSYAQNRDGSLTAERPARERAGFRVVSANLTALTDGVYACSELLVLNTLSGLRLAFYGLTDPTVQPLVQDGFVQIDAPSAPSLNGYDAVICLSNAGVQGAGWGDVLIDAPTGGEAVFGAWVYDRQTGIWTQETPLDGGADTAIEKLAASLREAAGERIGVSKVILNGADSVNWNAESNLGDLVTDALRWYAENYIDGLDDTLPLVAIQNGGNCDNFLYDGEITETDLLRALPFSPMGVGVVYLTGAQLLETLEAATQSADCPGFAQVSGLQYTLDLSEDYDGGAAYGSYYVADSVTRIRITQVDGKPFDVDATYAVVCDNFLIGGNDTYYTLAEAVADGATYLNNGPGVLTRDIVARYIKEVLGGTIGESYAEAQGRILINRTPYQDVDPAFWYREPINWAYEAGISSGVTETTFAPDGNCTRAQAVTLLWRALDCPEPEDTAVNPFSDVAEQDYFYKAVLWAVQEGIVSGTAADAFSPNLTIRRADLLCLLWRAAGSPEAANRAEFKDVNPEDYYAAAIDWASAAQIAGGVTAERFAPLEGCTRAQVVSFLYRWCAQ